MSYQETLDYLFQQLPMYQRQGKTAFKKDLDNINALVSLRNNRHKKYPTIHIAGTNGKGTCSHLIASCLQEAGMKVGLYTSPHYVDFRERIKVNGLVIPETFVVNFISDIRSQLEAIKPSFFEFSVAMAFEYFAEEQVDMAVIEVGLGGRLDSTNIIDPVVSVITNISLDHTEMLGNTLEEIASEKAGIIKQQGQVIVGKRQRETGTVFEKKVRDENALLIYAEDYFSVELNTADTQTFTAKLEGAIFISDSPCPISGPFATENLRTSIATLKLLSNTFEIEDEHIKAGIANLYKNVNYIGRWKIHQENPMVLSDSAHNKEALVRLFTELNNYPAERLHLVLGFTKEKELNDIIKLLPTEAVYYAVEAAIPRALSSTILFKFLQSNGLQAVNCGDVAKGYKTALQEAAKEDLVFIGGSSFVVGDFLRTQN